MSHRLLVVMVVASLAAATSGAAAGPPPSRIIYLDNCKPTGCVLTRATVDDSRTNRSSLISGTRTISAFAGTDPSWQAVVTCVRDTFAAFDVTITDVDPGNVPHWEVIAAGSPTDAGLANGTSAVGPFACGVIPNAISFAFLNLSPADVDFGCAQAAFAVAVALGLENEVLPGDVMSPAATPASRRFLDQTACVATTGTNACCSGASCQCGNPEQNSFQKLLGIFGAPTGPVDAGVDAAPAGDDAAPAAPDAGGAGAMDDAGGCCSTGGPAPAPSALVLAAACAAALRRRRASRSPRT